jgi:glycosyltransferase involved in cell wall biosynthesis
METLQEVFLCLAAQVDQDFELLLLCHDTSTENFLAIECMVRMQPCGLPEKVRVFDIRGGGRSAPLNVGLEAATGHYIAILDDDDLVLANWIEVFHAVATASPQKVVRSVSASQSVRVDEWPDRPGYSNQSPITCEYPADFNLIKHFAENQSPLMSLAFPISAFRAEGIRFDDQLPVLEDWDVLIQCALIFGVQDSEIVTSVYRKWETGENSASLHSESEWEATRQRVIAKFDKTSLTIPPGSFSKIAAISEAPGYTRSLERRLDEVLNSTSWRITRPFRKLSQMVRHYLRPVRRFVAITLSVRRH